MMRINIFFRRAIDILTTEGIVTLLKRVTGRYLFQYKIYFLYERKLIKREESDYLPRLSDFSVKIVSTNRQADELATDGLDFRSRFPNSRKGLDNGAIAFCIFANGELANIGWAGITEVGKNTFDYLPYHVDFSGGEACIGGSLTSPKFRGNRLMVYGNFLRFRYLSEGGIRIVRNAVDSKNLVAQRAHMKFDAKLYAKARYLKILGWQSWKEKPVA